MRCSATELSSAGEAIVRSEGAILDDTHWTRQVVLSSAK